MVVGILDWVLQRLLGLHLEIYKTAIDSAFYCRQTPSLLARLSPALHYRLFGSRHGLDPNSFFQTRWYLDRYADVRNQRADPLLHYLVFGADEQRDPGPKFDTDWYLNRYQDVKESGDHPFIHFLVHGHQEGRQPKGPPGLRQFLDRAAQYQLPRWSCSISDATPTDVSYVATSAEWISTGNDPQFLIGSGPERGFIYFQISIAYDGIRHAIEDEVNAQIYLDYGDGFSADNVLTFPVKDSLCAIDRILLLEKDVKAIRFDPVDTECRFTFNQFSIRTPEIDTVFRRVRNDAAVTNTDISGLDVSAVLNLLRYVSPPIETEADAYEAWIEARRGDSAEQARLSSIMRDLPRKPLISVIMPTYNSDIEFLALAVRSVVNQSYKHWELFIVDDGSNDPLLKDFLLAQQTLDDRIYVKLLQSNVGISAATNEALKVATGEFVAFLDHDDEYAPQALLAIADVICRHPVADMIYSDEDKIDEHGVRGHPFFKPDWSPEFLLGCMYTCHLSAYRRSLVDDIGGLRSEFDFAQDYDLSLRVSARAREIVHIPDILYHWRTLPSSTASSPEAKPTAELAARAALNEHIRRMGMQGEVIQGPFAGSHRVKLEVIGRPLVSIVIPTAGKRFNLLHGRWFLLDLLKSIRKSTTYQNLEIILVDNGDIESQLASELVNFDIEYVTYDKTYFNYSEKVNLGVAAAKGEFIILLNDDMTIITPNWIEELISWVQSPGIVAAGAKLLFPDETVQHAGVLLLGQGPSHAGYGSHDADPGLAGGAVLVRNYSAVTAACLCVSKANYELVGGFDPTFRVNYNDVDFCLRLLKLGRIVFTPFAKLYHHESVSRDASPSDELRFFNSKWADLVGFDPFYNRNLSQYGMYQIKRMR